MLKLLKMIPNSTKKKDKTLSSPNKINQKNQNYEHLRKDLLTELQNIELKMSKNEDLNKDNILTLLISTMADKKLK